MEKLLRLFKSEKTIKYTLCMCAALTALCTFIVCGILFKESFTFFSHVSFLEFFGSTQWEPLLEPRSFGIWPLVAGTAWIVLISSVVALPMGLGAAIYLSEMSSRQFRGFFKPMLEILAGIPTVVYGYFALSFITPIIRVFFPDTQIFNALSAGIVVGVMIIPMISSLCDDALRSLPPSLREGAYALGATRTEVVLYTLLPAIKSRLGAALILAVSRAIGETMAVTLAAGASPNLSLSPLKGIQTMTAFIVQVSLGDAPAGTVAHMSLYAVATLLFVGTFCLNIYASRLLRQEK